MVAPKVLEMTCTIRPTDVRFCDIHRAAAGEPCHSRTCNANKVNANALESTNPRIDRISVRYDSRFAGLNEKNDIFGYHQGYFLTHPLVNERKGFVNPKTQNTNRSLDLVKAQLYT